MTLEIQNNWAKVFDTKYGQVLMYYVFDSDKQEEVFHAMIKTPVAVIDLVMSSAEDDVIPAHFSEKATQLVAELIARNAFEFVENVGRNNDAAA